MQTEVMTMLSNIVEYLKENESNNIMQQIIGVKMIF